MKGRGPCYASPAQVASGNLIIKIKRGGVGRQSGSGPSGSTATPRAVLARALRNRAGVAAIVTARQAARVEAKKTPRRIIYGA
jgi:hypothetical protein